MTKWIKWVKGLVTKPEVLNMADELSMDPRTVAATCMLLWEWADDNTEDGNVPSITLALLSNVVGVTGFAESMHKHGWLSIQNNTIVFPKFDRHNSQSAKRRALTCERVHKKRNASSVTSALPDKIRLDKSINTPFSPPSGNGKKESAKRKPDPIWDATCQTFGLNPVTKSECNRVGGIVRDLKLKGATLENIKKTIIEYQRVFPKVAYTPEAILKHWDQLNHAPVVSSRPPDKTPKERAEIHKRMLEAAANTKAYEAKKARETKP